MRPAQFAKTEPALYYPEAMFSAQFRKVTTLTIAGLTLYQNRTAYVT